MRTPIKILGWAPKGEPVPKGQRSAEFFLKLSATPDATWKRLFDRQAEPLSALQKYNVTYELRGDLLRIWCPVALIATVVDSAKHLVSSTDIAALDFDNQIDNLRMQESGHEQMDWDHIEAEKLKIRFD
jgi:hypothetical protein